MDVQKNSHGPITSGFDCFKKLKIYYHQNVSGMWDEYENGEYYINGANLYLVFPTKYRREVIPMNGVRKIVIDS